ncbi:MAG: DUF1624 domain-containing protein [Firmicutes bacterium]|nr:DUF1624 domain-containing protein [Bacillota bacterium]
MDSNITAEKVKKERKKRAWELDFLRGLSILLVAMDHTFYDMAHLFGWGWKDSGVTALEKAQAFSLGYLQSALRFFWWPIFIFIFFCVSGICTAFSRNNLWRGIKLSIVALALSGATYLLDTSGVAEGSTIVFGVIHCIAVCIIVYAFIEVAVNFFAKNKNVKKYIKAGISFAIALTVLILNAVYNVNYRNVSVSAEYVVTSHFLGGLFVYTRDFWLISSDYFPLLPHLGFFMFGAGLSAIIYPNKKSLLPSLDRAWHLPVTIPGRFSLIVYVGSQIAVIGILVIVNYAYLGYWF